MFYYRMVKLVLTTMKKMSRNKIATFGVVLLLSCTIIIQATPTYKQSGNIEKTAVIEQNRDDEEKYILAIGPLGKRSLEQCEKIAEISKEKAMEIKECFQSQKVNNMIGYETELEIINFLKEYGILENCSEINNIVSQLENNQLTVDRKNNLADGTITNSHLCVGPHLWVYTNPLGSLFNYNIQPIDLGNKIYVLKDLLNISKENGLLNFFFNELTENMSLNSYLYMMGATIIIGGSLGRYWSFGFLDSAFGDMTYRITGPFVGMYALVATSGIIIFEDPKDGVDPERPWLEVDIGISMFSMQIETIVDFSP